MADQLLQPQRMCGPKFSQLRCPQGLCCSADGRCTASLDACMGTQNAKYHGHPESLCKPRDQLPAGCDTRGGRPDPAPMQCGPRQHALCRWDKDEDMCCRAQTGAALDRDAGVCVPCADVRRQGGQVWLWDGEARRWYQARAY